ncbi:putative xyloglucan-specific endo-beta-1,4-glucanase A [Colletotrichum spaethianum]|uniref:Xyloglucan-specific endo-beta-1,4-glucanase A n=1 Tax=Colletotrichum spaethianum TaxID=700344 RepID=A0AA37PHN6_9PEZI|nr:putative xyloglucan-specific endo-beta-1,4-glucanase A [Colletotrichum spaethianum]GKT52496.1 putative xyloglucan-specific endo-beta-1,4-glucanase A [Colletotrichum spaethianum]
MSRFEMRQWLVKLVPETIKTAAGVGIGFFLTETGLPYSAGIGAITGVARCPVEMIDAETQMCAGGIMSSPKLWTAIFAGGIFTAYLMSFRAKYAFIMGIALVSILSWPGVFVHTFLNSLMILTVWLSGGRLEPLKYDAKEYWSWRASGTKP